VADHVHEYYDGCGSGHRRGRNSGMVLHEGQEDIRRYHDQRETRERELKE